MRHVAVRRAALILATVFVLFAGLFAWMAGRGGSHEQISIAIEEAPQAAAEHRGAALYDTYCARCHPVETLRGPLNEERYRELLANDPELQAYSRAPGWPDAVRDRLRVANGEAVRNE